MSQLALRVSPIAAVRRRILVALDWPHVARVYIRVATMVVGTRRLHDSVLLVRGPKLLKDFVVVRVERRFALRLWRRSDTVPFEAYASSPVEGVHSDRQLRRGEESEIILVAVRIARVLVLKEGGPHHLVGIRVDVADLSDAHENIVHVAAVSERRLQEQIGDVLVEHVLRGLAHLPEQCLE